MPRSWIQSLAGWWRRSAQTSAKPSHAPPIEVEPPAAADHAQSQLALREGRYGDAIALLERIVEIEPTHAAALTNLGFALIEVSRHAEALPVLRAASALDEHSPDLHYLLGSALAEVGDFEASIEHLEAATRHRSGFVVAQRDLARSLHRAGRHADARAVLSQALAAHPEAAELHYFLGNIQQEQLEPEAAIESYRAALRIEPAFAQVFSNLAPAHLAMGEYELAAAAARRALAIDPLMHSARSNLLVALSSTPLESLDDYLDEARAYGAIVTASVAAEVMPPASRDATSEPARPLRVGFVSADLHSHPVGYFLEGLMTAWDADRMIAVAYSNDRGDDDLTARLRARFAEWRDIASLTDVAAARRIRDDAIDVLVDLSGHTAGNRLPMFALRPAAVQVSWLGYWASTGLPAIDHLLADPVSLPPDARRPYTEQVACLPVTRLCFTPPTSVDGASFGRLTAPPAVLAGHVTFGSFQRLTKINDRTLALWAAVMQRLPAARLRLQAARLTTEPTRSTMLGKLEAHGIEPARVDLADASSRAAYFEAHGAVDIVLDTFPHTGATTTCEALWMGVPTVTLAGPTMLSRQGASVLAAVGLSDWVAVDDASFVERAVRHASDTTALARLRLALRPTLLSSPLTDAPAFAQHFQTLVEAMVGERGRARRRVD